MKVLVATTFRVIKQGDRYFAKNAFADIICRYNERFGKIFLCLPLESDVNLTSSHVDISQMVEGVFHITRMDAILHKKDVELRKVIEKVDVIIARCPSNVAFLASDVAHKVGKTVMAEAMGCAWDAYWNHGLIGKLMAPYMYWKMKNVLKHADYALYVTEQFLQRRYPCPNTTVGVSDVVIHDIDSTVRKQRLRKIELMDRNNIVLMTCAAVNVWYKGQHFAIRAIPKLNQMGIRVKYYCVGQGDQSYLRKIAQKFGVEDQVVFTGPVAHERIFELLDKCDIYLQPSLQEGLPRAMVEAMSRGCPCIGARTGGIPELVGEECVVERKAVNQIAEKVAFMLRDGLQRYSFQNLEKASSFSKKVLDERRNAFFEQIEDR